MTSTGAECPLCSSVRCIRASIALTLSRCPDCGLRFRAPQPDDVQLRAIYELAYSAQVVATGSRDMAGTGDAVGRQYVQLHPADVPAELVELQAHLDRVVGGLGWGGGDLIDHRLRLLGPIAGRNLRDLGAALDALRELRSGGGVAGFAAVSGFLAGKLRLRGIRRRLLADLLSLLFG